MVQFRDVRLDKILEDREHLLIRINLMEEGDSGRATELSKARQELADVEAELAAHRAGTT
jgi:hypothetical protein